MSATGGEPASRRQAPPGRHRRPRTPCAAVSPRALRRHEATGGDRHGVDGQAQAVRRRRTDDGPRRHGAAADLRLAAPGQPRRGSSGPADLPRRRGGRRAVRSDRRDVRRPHRRGGERGNGAGRRRSSLYASPRRRRPGHDDRPPPSPGDDSRPAAGPPRRRRRLRLCPAMCVRRRSLPRRAADTAARSTTGGGLPAGIPRRISRRRRERGGRGSGEPAVTCATCRSTTARGGGASSPSTTSASTFPPAVSSGSSVSPGSGKSTLAKAIVGLVPLAGGTITLEWRGRHGRRTRRERAPATHPDGVPGPVLLARPAHDRRRVDGRGAHRSAASQPRRAAWRDRPAARTRVPRSGGRGGAASPAVRRPTATRLHRPGLGAPIRNC